MKRVMEMAHSLLYGTMHKVAHLSDWFVCTKCRYGMYKKVLGNTATCPECNGEMKRTEK